MYSMMVILTATIAKDKANSTNARKALQPD
jgi:hypothetical protein